MTRTDAGRGWMAVVPFFAANVLFASGLWAHAFLYNFYLDDLGLGEGVMGLAAASLTAGGLAALVPAGLVLDRWGPRPTYVTAAAVAAVGLLLGAFAETSVAIYVGAVVAGAGAAAWRVAMGPALMLVAEGHVRARAFSWNVALLIGFGAVWTGLSGQVPGWLSGVLGGSDLLGLRWTLVMGALVTLLAGPAFFGVPLQGTPKTPRDRSALGRRGSLESLLLPRRLFLLVGIVFLWMIAGGLVLPFFNVYFLRVHALPVDGIGALFAGVQILTAVALFGGGELARRLGPRSSLAIWAVIFAPALWGMALAGPLMLAVGLYAISGLIPPATNPLIDQILLEEADAEAYGVVSTWRNTATELSGFVGAGVGGFLLEGAGFGVLFGVAGAVAAAGALALVGALRVQAPDA